MTRCMDTWNRLTGLGVGGWEGGGEGWKKLAKELICIAYGHKQQCGEGQRWGLSGGRQSGGKAGDICNSANNNNTKIIKKRMLCLYREKHPGLSHAFHQRWNRTVPTSFLSDEARSSRKSGGLSGGCLR